MNMTGRRYQVNKSSKLIFHTSSRRASLDYNNILMKGDLAQSHSTAANKILQCDVNINSLFNLFDICVHCAHLSGWKHFYLICLRKKIEMIITVSC